MEGFWLDSLWSGIRILLFGLNCVWIFTNRRQNSHGIRVTHKVLDLGGNVGRIWRYLETSHKRDNYLQMVTPWHQTQVLHGTNAPNIIKHSIISKSCVLVIISIYIIYSVLWSLLYLGKIHLISDGDAKPGADTDTSWSIKSCHFPPDLHRTKIHLLVG